MKVSLTDDTAVLEMNGLPVYERKLESTNRRHVSRLFHFPDQFELKVRNVTMRGDWPKTLPSIADQQLAGETTDFLDQRLPKLTADFTHNFAADGLPAEFFRTPKLDAPRDQLSLLSDGLFASVTTPGTWSYHDLVVPLELDGDFDVEASFDQLRLAGTKHAAIMMNVNLLDEPQNICQIKRSQDASQRQILDATTTRLRDGKRSNVSREIATCEAASGRLRLARRGSEVYFLFAEGDSPVFRLFGRQTVTAAKTRTDGISLRVLADGDASCRVVWKSIRLRAEKLAY